MSKFFTLLFLALLLALLRLAAPTPPGYQVPARQANAFTPDSAQRPARQPAPLAGRPARQPAWPAKPGGYYAAGR